MFFLVCIFDGQLFGSKTISHYFLVFLGKQFKECIGAGTQTTQNAQDEGVCWHLNGGLQEIFEYIREIFHPQGAKPVNCNFSASGCLFRQNLGTHHRSTPQHFHNHRWCASKIATIVCMFECNCMHVEVQLWTWTAVLSAGTRYIYMPIYTPWGIHRICGGEALVIGLITIVMRNFDRGAPFK